MGVTATARGFSLNSREELSVDICPDWSAEKKGYFTHSKYVKICHNDISVSESWSSCATPGLEFAYVYLKIQKKTKSNVLDVQVVRREPFWCHGYPEILGAKWGASWSYTHSFTTSSPLIGDLYPTISLGIPIYIYMSMVCVYVCIYIYINKPMDISWHIIYINGNLRIQLMEVRKCTIYKYRPYFLGRFPEI